MNGMLLKIKIIIKRLGDLKNGAKNPLYQREKQVHTINKYMDMSRIKQSGIQQVDSVKRTV